MLQGEALLLHFNFLFATGDELLFPLVTLVFEGAQQVRVLQHQNGVALLQHVALLAHNALHTACLAGVDLDGEDGLHQSFHIDVFHELALPYFGHLKAIGVDAQLARPCGENDNVHQQGCGNNSTQQVIAVADVPGFLFEFDIHSRFFMVHHRGHRVPQRFDIL